VDFRAHSAYVFPWFEHILETASRAARSRRGSDPRNQRD
jgi:hypothetical protein